MLADEMQIWFHFNLHGYANKTCRSYSQFLFFEARFSLGSGHSVKHAVVELGNVSTRIYHPKAEDSKYVTMAAL